MIRYEKTIWENDKTPVNAQHLSKVEDGLEYLFDVIKDVPAGEDSRIVNEKQRQVNETTRQNNELKRNDTLNAKVKEVDNAIIASNNNIKEVNNKFETIVASKQQDAEVILARGKYPSLPTRLDNLDKDLLNVKDTAIIPVTTESNFVTVEETVNGYLTDFKIEGKTFIVNSENQEVEPGTEGATLKSVGDGVEEIVISSVKADGNLIDKFSCINKRIISVNGAEISNTENWNATKYILINKKRDLNLFGIKNSKVSNNSVFVCYYNSSKRFISCQEVNVLLDSVKLTIPEEAAYLRLSINTLDLDTCYLGVKSTYEPYIGNKKKALYYDTETQTWKKPVLREWDSIEEHSNDKYYYHKRSEERVYRENDETNLEVITDKTNTVYKLVKEKVFECTPIDLIAYKNETDYMVECGPIIPKSSFKYEGNIGNVINTLKEKVSYLEDKLYKTNLANFTVALNALDTKLKLEQLVKTPK